MATSTRHGPASTLRRRYRAGLRAEGLSACAAAAAGPLRRTSAFQKPIRQCALKAATAHKRAAADEEGAAPLDALLDLGAGGVHHLAQALDDRLGEGGSLTQVGVEGEVALGHSPSLGDEGCGWPAGSVELAAVVGVDHELVPGAHEHTRGYSS